MTRPSFLSLPAGRARAVTVAVLAAVALAAGVWLTRPAAGSAAGVEVVKPAPFEVTITGVGDLVPRKRRMIAATFSGKVETLIEEGKDVKAGTVVATLGTQEIEERLQEHEIEQEAARKDLEVRAATARRDREKARTDLASARADLALQQLLLRQLVAGVPRAEVQELAWRADAAAQARAHAEAAYAAQVDLVEKGVIRPLDLKQGQVDLANARKGDAVAQTALRIARAGYADDQIEAQRLEVRKAATKRALAERELAFLERSRRLQREVDLARVKYLGSRVAEQRHRMAEATLKAPAAGVVVLQSTYTNSGRKKLQVGDEARESQAFMEIADVSSIYVQSHVREADFGRVKPGMPARITLSSLGKTFPGKLTELGVLAKEQPGLVNREGARKVFEAKIETDERSPAFRPGMTVDVALIVQTIPAALSVPNEAIFHEAGAPHVKARRPGGGWEPRAVTLGARSEQRSQVVAGLAAGDEVYVGEPK